MSMIYLQRRIHLFGQYGVTMSILSGLDVVFSNSAGKAAEPPLWRLISGHVRNNIPGYSILFNYSDPDLVAEKTKQSIEESYDSQGPRIAATLC